MTLSSSLFNMVCVRLCLCVFSVFFFYVSYHCKHPEQSPCLHLFNDSRTITLQTNLISCPAECTRPADMSGEASQHCDPSLGLKTIQAISLCN